MTDTSVILNPEPVIRRPELRRASAASSQINSTNDSHRQQRPVTVSYELSEDIRAKEVGFIERRYGGRIASQRAAKIIQSTYREYQLRKDYDKLKIEKRVSRRLDLPTINHNNQSLFRSPVSPTSPEIIKISKTDLKKQNSYEDLVIERAYKDWDTESNDDERSMKRAGENKVEKKKSQNIDSGAESIENSSVSLTPSPTSNTNFTNSLSYNDSDVSTIKRDSIDSNFNNKTSTDNFKKSTDENLNNCDKTNNSSSQNNPLKTNKNTITSNITPPKPLTICADLNSSVAYTNCSPKTPKTSNSCCSSSSNFNFPKQSPFSANPVAAGYLSNPRLIGCNFQKSCYCHLVNDRKHRRLYRICLNIFNKNPVKGVSFLIRYRFVEVQPHLLAKFLMTRKGISRISIGDFLGQTKDQLALDTLKYFTRMVDMKHKDIDTALRHLLSFFQIPGESQKIKQIMEEFQESYVEQNPDWKKNFQSPDTVMILAYAIIMLHTDMYNPSIRKNNKMTKEGFIYNLRNVDDGHDINPDLLSRIYDRIKMNEMKTFSDHTTQVRKMDKHFCGSIRPSSLVQPHRRLVCYCRLYEVPEGAVKKKERAHPRDLFLFNDLLVVCKAGGGAQVGTSGPGRDKEVRYQCRKVIAGLGRMQVFLFESIVYPCGIQIKWPVDDANTSSSSNNAGGGNSSSGFNVLQFNTRTLSDRKRFVDDLMETICEVKEMERIRIEEELIKQCVHEKKGSESDGDPMVTSGCCDMMMMDLNGINSFPGSHFPNCPNANNNPSQISPQSCLHTSRSQSIDYYHNSCSSNNTNLPIGSYPNESYAKNSNFVFIRQSDSSAVASDSHQVLIEQAIMSTGGMTTSSIVEMSSSTISTNVYNPSYRISGDSGLQEDIE